MDEVDESSSVVICIFSERHVKASHLHAEDPCMDESAIMMHSDTKKRCTHHVEIHYNTSRHEHTPRGGGLARVAGQSCLAGPSVLQLHPYSGHRTGEGIVRQSRAESQAFFCALGITCSVSASIPTSRIPSASVYIPI